MKKNKQQVIYNKIVQISILMLGHNHFRKKNQKPHTFSKYPQGLVTPLLRTTDLQRCQGQDRWEAGWEPGAGGREEWMNHSHQQHQEGERTLVSGDIRFRGAGASERWRKRQSGGGNREQGGHRPTSEPQDTVYERHGSHCLRQPCKKQCPQETAISQN